MVHCMWPPVGHYENYEMLITIVCVCGRHFDILLDVIPWVPFLSRLSLALFHPISLPPSRVILSSSIPGQVSHILAPTA